MLLDTCSTLKNQQSILKEYVLTEGETGVCQGSVWIGLAMEKGSKGLIPEFPEVSAQYSSDFAELCSCFLEFHE